MGSIVVLENGVGFERMVSNLFMCIFFLLLLLQRPPFSVYMILFLRRGFRF